MEIARRRILNLEEVLGEYIVYQKNEEKFQEHMQKKVKKYEEDKLRGEIKDGTKGSIHNDKQQVVSTP